MHVRGLAEMQTIDHSTSRSFSKQTRQERAHLVAKIFLLVNSVGIQRQFFFPQLPSNGSCLWRVSLFLRLCSEKFLISWHHHNAVTSQTNEMPLHIYIYTFSYHAFIGSCLQPKAPLSANSNDLRSTAALTRSFSFVQSFSWYACSDIWNLTC